MLLMFEIALEKHVMQFIDMQKLITNIWKIMVKIKNHHNVNNVFGWEMLQKLPVNKFEWIAYLTKFL